MRKVLIGLYGFNGHQLQPAQVEKFDGEIVAIAGPAPEAVVADMRERGVAIYITLDELLADERVELVSLCSPFRRDQDADAVKCLEAGKHVYGEKPSAMTVAGIDRIIEAAKRTGKIYHEQAGVALNQPYATLREVVQSGVLGEIVQVFSQKSYPWFDARPQDENVDGGLGTQVAVYNARFVEHITGVKIKSLIMRDTKLGNPVPGGECRRAVSMLMELENGGLSSALANYLCPFPPAWEHWGYETVRIFGTNGFAESIDMGRIGTLSLNGQPAQPLDFSAPTRDYLEMFFEEIRTGQPVIPFTLEEELSPTRWVVGAREELRRA